MEFSVELSRSMEAFCVLEVLRRERHSGKALLLRSDLKHVNIIGILNIIRYALVCFKIATSLFLSTPLFFFFLLVL